MGSLCVLSMLAGNGGWKPASNCSSGGVGISVQKSVVAEAKEIFRTESMDEASYNQCRIVRHTDRHPPSCLSDHLHVSSEE